MKSAASVSSGKLLLLQKPLQGRFNKRAAVGAADKAQQRGHACASEHLPEAPKVPGSPLGDAVAQTVFRAQDQWTLGSRRTTGGLLEDRNKEALQNGSPSVGKDGRVCSDLVEPVLKRTWEGRDHSREENYLLCHLLVGHCW